MLKKVLFFILLVVFSCSSVYATPQTQYEKQALMLQELGLLKGGNAGFELDRAPKRIEAAVMLVRLLGKESEVLSGNFTHPFKDVPLWGSKYIGYMYENGLTKGKSALLFGSDDLTDSKSYLTFVLRALGYNDSQGDFYWSTALAFGAEKGVLSLGEMTQYGDKSFLRDDMVYFSSNALLASMKGTNTTLVEKLVESGAVDSLKAESAGLVKDVVSIGCKTVMLNGRLVSTLDVSSLPLAAGQKVTFVGWGSSYKKDNAYSLEAQYLLNSNITTADTKTAPYSWTHSFSENGKTYETMSIRIYVDNHIYGFSQIISPVVGERQLSVHVWNQTNYNQYVLEKKNELKEMADLATSINPNLIGWAQTNDMIVYYDFNDVIQKSGFAYSNLMGGVAANNNNVDVIISMFLSNLGFGEEIAQFDDYNKVDTSLSRYFGIASTGHNGEYRPSDNSRSNIMFYDQNKEFIAYSLLDGSMTPLKNFKTLVLRKKYELTESGPRIDPHKDYLSLEFLVKINGKTAFKVKDGYAYSVESSGRKHLESTDENETVNSDGAIYLDSTKFISNPMYFGDAIPTIEFIGDNKGFVAEFK